MYLGQVEVRCPQKKPLGNQARHRLGALLLAWLSCTACAQTRAPDNPAADAQPTAAATGGADATDSGPGGPGAAAAATANPIAAPQSL